MAKESQALLDSRALSQLGSTPGYRPLRFVIVFASAFVLYYVSSHFAAPTPYNHYVVLADAWLHGHVWIESPGAYVQEVIYAGKNYIIEGPMPAVLMLPLVAVAGLDANQSFVSVTAAAAAIAAFDLLLFNMKVEPRLRAWLVVFLAAGTVFWWCAANPRVWMVADVVSTMFLIFGLAEWYGNRRYWLVGFFFACAALSRFPVMLIVVPFVYWMWTERAGRLRNLGSFLLGLAPLLVLQALYNYARWHTPLFDIGYILFYHKDPAGSPTGSPFALGHLPFNLYSWFFMAPDFSSDFPWIRPNLMGVALSLTSPAFALALLAPKSKESAVLWSSAILIAIPSLLYFTNGYSQFGMRHTLDFTPVLLCLMARGFGRYPSGLGYGLIVYSVLANAYGVWYSSAYHLV